jgi:hypothetical protein
VMVGLVVLTTLLRIAARRPRSQVIVNEPAPLFEDSHGNETAE